MPESEGKGYRGPFRPGKIGSEEGRDPMEPGPQRVDTKSYSATETRDQECHSSVYTLREAGVTVGMRSYSDFMPRTAPMPRATQDDLYLQESAGRRVADPHMTDNDSETNLLPREIPGREDLFGPNRDGVSHNQNMVPTSDTQLYHPIDAVSENERAQLSQRRGMAAAGMPHGQEQKDFISRQGDTEAINKSRTSYNRMSLEAAEKGQ